MDRPKLEQITGLELSRFPPDTDGGDPPIYSATISSTRAFDRVQEIIQKIKPLGCLPVMVGDADDLESLSESFEVNAGHDRQADMLQAEAIDVQAWLHQCGTLDEACFDPPRGDWPEDVQPSSGFYFTVDSRGKERSEFAMLLAPAKESWQLPVSLHYGGWNDCPHPAEHAAMLRSWTQRFSAEVVAICSDTIELMVPKPPQTREGAIELALEQYLYCPDIVDQGTGTIENLAAGLLNGWTWFFWWD